MIYIIDSFDNSQLPGYVWKDSLAYKFNPDNVLLIGNAAGRQSGEAQIFIV